MSAVQEQKPRQKGWVKEQTKVAEQKQKPWHECYTKEQLRRRTGLLWRSRNHDTLGCTKEQTEDDYVVGRQVETDRLPLGTCAQGTVSADLLFLPASTCLFSPLCAKTIRLLITRMCCRWRPNKTYRGNKKTCKTRAFFIRIPSSSSLSLSLPPPPPPSLIILYQQHPNIVINGIDSRHDRSRRQYQRHRRERWYRLYLLCISLFMSDIYPKCYLLS